MARPQLVAALLGAIGLGLSAVATHAQSTAQPPVETTTAGEPGQALEIELNKIEPFEGACRIYLVLRSTMPGDLDTLLLELVTFDGEGVISQRMAVDLAPLRRGKLTVKTFDVPQTPCERVTRLLVNDALECRAASGPVDDCLGAIQTASRGPVELMK
jgi:hypothetical protein